MGDTGKMKAEGYSCRPLDKYGKSLDKETICLAKEVRLRKEFWGGIVFHRDTVVDIDIDAFILLSLLKEKNAAKLEDLLAAFPGKGKGNNSAGKYRIDAVAVLQQFLDLGIVKVCQEASPEEHAFCDIAEETVKTVDYCQIFRYTYSKKIIQGVKEWNYMSNEIMRISAKGQLTIPVNIRKKLNIREGDYVQISIENNEARIKKVNSVKPLSSEDPIWEMVGSGNSGYKDVSVNHDQYVAEGETKRWKQS